MVDHRFVLPDNRGNWTQAWRPIASGAFLRARKDERHEVERCYGFELRSSSSSYQSDVIELSSVPFVITVGDQHFVDDEDLDLQKCSMIWNRKRKLVTLRARLLERGCSTLKRPATRLPLPFHLSFQEA